MTLSRAHEYEQFGMGHEIFRRSFRVILVRTSFGVTVIFRTDTSTVVVPL